MHRPSWLRRSKKPKAKAAATTSSNPTSLASPASNVVTTPGPGHNDASSVPQNNSQSRGSLWDKAYENLQADKKELVEVFEKLLLSEPEIPLTSTLADGDPSKREKQMSTLIAKKLETMKQEQWKLQIGGKSIEVRQQVDRIVKVVLFGKEFITSAASMDPIHAGLPWAGVCMLLPLITKDSEQRTAATDGLEYISDLIRRYTQVEQIYLADENSPLKDDLQSSIMKLYRHVLDWKTIIVAIKDLEAACDKLTWVIDAEDQRVRTTRLESYLERQNHEVRELFRVSIEQEEEQGKVQLAELKAGRQEQKDWHRNAEESACYECLRTTDYESNKNKNPDRIPGTCEWFLRHPKYKKWLEEQWSTWLWVTADPGCGKSVLSRFLIDEYKNGPSDANTICYYFFKDDSEEGRSATHALCAILHQLFSQNNKLLRHAFPEYRRNGNKLPQLFNELWSIFTSAAADPDAGSIVCIVDALDECAKTTRLPLITALARYYQAPGVTMKLKFIIISRPYASIGDAFWEENPNVASIQLMGESEAEMEDIRVEIDLVIEEKVKRFNNRRLRKGVDDDAHIAVQEQLRSIDNQTYLWVALVFPELEKNAGIAKSRLLQVINIIPKLVDEAYKRILSRSSNQEQAKKLLHILVAAKRPLNLTEMNITLFMKEGATSVEDLELDSEQSFWTRVRDLCGLFVVIRDSTVYFMHQTAKEFLGAETNLEESALGWTALIFATKKGHKDIVEILLENGAEVNAQAKDGDTALMLATSWKNEAIVKTLLRHHADSNIQSKSGDSVLMIAARRDHSEIVKMLLESNADPNIQGEYGHTALTITANKGNETIVKMLLKSNADPNIQNKTRDTALMYAARWDHREIVKMLLESNADLNIQNESGDTALIMAAYWDHTEIVKMLLESSADPNIQDKDDDTALMGAARYDHAEIVRMLLESSADPNIQDNYGNTALIIAAEINNETVVKMLLESSADPNIQDNWSITALMWAAGKGNAEIVKMLLERNANPMIQTDAGKTAMTSAKEEKANLDMRLGEVEDAEERSKLLARTKTLQAIINMLHVHETEPAAISNNNNDRSNTLTLSNTPGWNRSEEVTSHKNEDPNQTVRESGA